VIVAATAHAISDRCSRLAHASLRLELETWPKPGLVSHVDNGSHADMDAATFRRSAAVLQDYFAELADAGARDRDMQALRAIGLRAERGMLCVTGGVNTHRGAIFGMGLLCAAAGYRDARRTVRGLSLGAIVRRQWGAGILAARGAPSSHGEQAARRHGAGGARREASLGFRSVYGVGLPALEQARRMQGADAEAIRVQVCFELVAVLEDTNLLHRGGVGGLRFAQRAARAFLARGGIAQAGWRSIAAATHRDFVARGLSPGGSADLLSMTLFADALGESDARGP
jgi:triphosphoribosyl-dephospho-CoA synthase